MNIYTKAIAHFGTEPQHLKLIEEMAELTQAIIKRTQGHEHNIAEEIADTQIVLDQLKLLHPDWISWQQVKLARLQNLINNV
jgi:phosphoribosyl-ATP pyrophosphohydrolase